jgi:hypothetical protein
MFKLNASRSRRTAWPSTLFALAVVAAPALCRAAVQSELDRTTVAVNEPLTLSIVSDSARSGVEPDLAPLRKDFSLLGSEASSETSIVNGARSDRMRWIIRLMPLHAGNVEIPAIAVGADHTAAIDLTVTPPSAAAQAEASGHAFLEVDTVAAGQSAFVQQSIPYTVRLFIDGTVQNGELKAPEAPDAAIEQVGKDQRYTTSRRGRDYTVIERRYVISPEKSGALKIAPASFQGTAVVPVAATPGAAQDDDPTDDLMARMLRNTPFANDPMFRNGLMANLGAPQQTRPVAAQSRELTLTVKPRPSDARGDWLPAQALTLHDSWQDAAPPLRVGEPVTRVITIEAKGVAASQIPTLAPIAPASARVYPESADNQTTIAGQSVDAVSRQTVTYIPSADGTLDVPALEVAWWDTRAGEQRTATLPAMHLQVAPGAAGASAAQVPAPAATDASPAASSATAESGFDGAAVATAWRALRVQWRWLAAALVAIGLVVMAAAAARRARANPKHHAATSKAQTFSPSPAPELPGKRATLRELRQACAVGDRQAAAKALLDLGRLEWPDDPPRGLVALAARLRSGSAEILALDRRLYGTDSSPWSGEALREAVGDGLRPSSPADSAQASGLEALYRSDAAGARAH